VSVFRLLAAAAALGAVVGAVLARRAPRPDQDTEATDRAVLTAIDRVLPAGSQATSPDPMAPDPLSLRGIPAYPGASPRRVTGAQRSGEPLNAISWFTTGDSVDQVLGFYEQAYRAANLMHTAQRWERRGYVSWFEYRKREDGSLGPGDGVLHLVAAMNEGSQTIVLVAATDPKKLLESMAPLPAGVSLPPGAGRTQVINLGEAGHERSSVFAPYAHLGREALATALEASLTSGGWVVEERGHTPDGKLTLVARRGTTLQLAVVAGSKQQSQVLISLEPSAPSKGPP
jgi:hypothetical protein